MIFFFDVEVNSEFKIVHYDLMYFFYFVLLSLIVSEMITTKANLITTPFLFVSLSLSLFILLLLLSYINAFFFFLLRRAWLETMKTSRHWSPCCLLCLQSLPLATTPSCMPSATRNSDRYVGWGNFGRKRGLYRKRDLVESGDPIEDGAE